MYTHVQIQTTYGVFVNNLRKNNDDVRFVIQIPRENARENAIATATPRRPTRVHHHRA